MVSGAKEGVRPRHLRSHDSTIEMNGGKTGSWGPDLENVPSQPSAARFIFSGSGKFFA